MHTIEPFDNWSDLYVTYEDELSPFYCKDYEEREEEYYTIYNYVINPKWDSCGSPTLYLKILYVDYKLGFCIIELLGEWNDCLNNDIMFLKRNVADVLISNNVKKFILIGENVLIFHSGDNSYYQEWAEEIEDGWIAAINFRKHLIDDFISANLDYYLVFGGQLNSINWRTYHPVALFNYVDKIIKSRISLQ